MRPLVDQIAEVLGIGVLFWLSDAALLASRGRGEIDPLHLVFALGACSLVCMVAVLLVRRDRAAIVLITVFAGAALWLVVFGPAMPPAPVAAMVVVIAVVAVAVSAWITPGRLVIAIPAILLLHHVLITHRMPGVITIAMAVILTPSLPPLYRVLRANPRLLVAAGALSIAMGVIAAGILRGRVDSRSWTSRPAAVRRSWGTNIVLVVLDTLRADRLGAYGYHARASTPFLDSFARSATVFPRAYAASSWTLPSVASMFTGLTCGRHGLVTGRGVLPPDRPTLAETLRAAGYFTTGISANFTLDDETGFTRGFDRYAVLWRLVRGNRTAVPSIWDDLNAVLTTYYRGWIAIAPGWNWKPRAAQVTDRAIAALDDAPRDRPVFLYVHYVDPHAPCDAVSHDRWKVGIGDRPYDAKWSLEYDREVRDLDAALAKLGAHIDRRLEPRNTLLIIVADHGEQLGEGGKRGHGRNLSEATIRVPLMVRFPAPPAGLEPKVPFSTARIFDLIETAAGLPASRPSTSLVNSSIVTGDTLQRVVIDGPHKFVQRWQLHPPRLLGEELFLLPDEKHDVLAENRAGIDRLRRAAEADPLPRGTENPTSDEMRAKLRALGYLR